MSEHQAGYSLALAYTLNLNLIKIFYTYLVAPGRVFLSGQD
jgi:hypothetical protein